MDMSPKNVLERGGEGDSKLAKFVGRKGGRTKKKLREHETACLSKKAPIFCCDGVSEILLETTVSNF